MAVSHLTAGEAERQTRARSKQSVTYFLVFILVGLTSASLGPTLPGLANHLGASLGVASSLFPIRSFGYLIGSLFSGRLYDRFLAHPIMAGMMALTAALMALAPVLPVFIIVAGVFFLIGVGEAFMDVGGNTLIVWVHGKDVGPFLNALHFFFGIGAALSPLIVAQVLAASGGFTLAYWIIALLYVPVVAWLLRQPTPRYGDTTQAHAAGGDGAPRPAGGVLVGLITLFFFLYVSGEVSMGGWSYSYAAALGLGNEITAAYLTSAFWGALTVGRLLSIPIAARMRPSRILWMDLTGVAVSLGLVLAFPGSAAALWTGVIGTGLFMASIFPTMLALAGQRMAITGRAMGLFLVAGSLGGMSMPWIIGQLFEPAGPRVVMVVIAAVMGLALGVYALVWARSLRTEAG